MSIEQPSRGNKLNPKIERLFSILTSKQLITDGESITPDKIITILWLSEESFEYRINQIEKYWKAWETQTEVEAPNGEKTTNDEKTEKDDEDSNGIISLIKKIESIYLIEDIIPDDILKKYCDARDSILNDYSNDVEKIEDKVKYEKFSLNSKKMWKKIVDDIFKRLENKARTSRKNAFVECINEYVKFLKDSNFSRENVITNTDKQMSENLSKKFEDYYNEHMDEYNKNYNEYMNLYNKRKILVKKYRAWSSVITEKTLKIKEIDSKIDKKNSEITRLTRRQNMLTGIISKTDEYNTLKENFESEYLTFVAMIAEQKESIDDSISEDIKTVQDMYWNVGLSIDDSQEYINNIRESWSKQIEFLDFLVSHVADDTMDRMLPNELYNLCKSYGYDEIDDNMYDILRYALFLKQKAMDMSKNHTGIISKNYMNIHKEEIEEIKDQVNKNLADIKALKKEKKAIETQIKGKWKWGRQRKDSRNISDDDIFDDEKIITDFLHPYETKRQEEANNNVTISDVEYLEAKLNKIDKKMKKLKREILTRLDKINSKDTVKGIIDLFWINMEQVDIIHETDELDNSDKMDENEVDNKKLSEKIDKEKNNRFWLFIKLLLENKILSIVDLQDQSKIRIYKEKYWSYYYICLYGSINKIFCISNEPWNATFVYYDTDFEKLKEIFTSKNSIKSTFDSTWCGIYFSCNNAWISNIMNAISMDGIINTDELWEENFEAMEQEKEIASDKEVRSYFADKVYEEDWDIKIKIWDTEFSSATQYVTIRELCASDFESLTGKKLPEEIADMIDLLWWDSSKCEKLKYLYSLIISREKWDEYLKSIKTNRFFGVKDKEIVAKFRSFMKSEWSRIKWLLSNPSELSLLFDKYLKDAKVETDGKTLSPNKDDIIEILWWRYIPYSGKKFYERYVKVLISNPDNRKNVYNEYLESEKGKELLSDFNDTLDCLIEFFAVNYDKPQLDTKSYKNFVFSNGNRDKFEKFLDEKWKRELFKPYRTHTFPSMTTIRRMFVILDDDDNVDGIKKLNMMITERKQKNK